MVEGILLTIVTAATPLLFAALGELIAERSGVLNLGVEGMMAVGAVMGFAGGHVTGMPIVGVLTGIVAGAAMGGLFGIVTLVFAANQNASGHCADAVRARPVRPDRQRLHRHARPRACARIHIPVLSDIPVIGPVIFGEDPLVYLAVALTIAVWLFLFRTNAGLILRAVGDNHASAHALGYPVLRVRFLAVLFGGACAGLGGAYLSLVYTPQWTQAMTAGRGWIAIALVVFGTWLPGRIAIGALLFGARQHPAAQRAGLRPGHSLAVPVRAAVPDHGHRAGDDLAQSGAAARSTRRPRWRAPSCPTIEQNGPRQWHESCMSQRSGRAADNGRQTRGVERMRRFLVAAGSGSVAGRGRWAAPRRPAS